MNNGSFIGVILYFKTKIMDIEIITIGDEILIGQIVDTNSAWMANLLTQAGFNIAAITSVGDDSISISKALDIALHRADVVLMTGGIGPTKDDVTKSTLCRYFHSELIFNNSVLENIENIFKSKNIKLNELTKNQARVPSCAKVIQNCVGTAPLLWFDIDEKVLVSMPGVAFEMKNAMQQEILPRFIQKFSTEKFLKKFFVVSGISESGLAMKLENFENQLPKKFSLAYLPAGGLIRLRLSVRGKEFEEEFHHKTCLLKEELLHFLICEDDLSLEEILHQLCTANKLTLATAESCTGGNIAHAITRIAGASEYFKGSIVSYTNKIKENILQVNPSTLEKYGAVSEKTVEEMSFNCQKIFNTDCSISVSGIAGPDGGTNEYPVGCVWISTRFKDISKSEIYHFGKVREENITRATNMAILQMIKQIKKNL